MKKIFLVAWLGSGVVLAQSAGVGNNQFVYPVSSSSGVTINATLHQRGAGPYAFLVANSAPANAIACNVPGSTVCNYTTDAAGDLTFTFNPAFGPGVIEIASGGGTVTTPASAAQLAYYANADPVVAGTSNLYYNGTLLSLGQAIASMDPFVTLGEFYDSTSTALTTTTTKTSFEVNAGAFPNSSLESQNARWDAIRGVVNCPASATALGACVGVTGYALSSSPTFGSIGGYFAGLVGAASNYVFGINPIVVDRNSITSGTSFPVNLMVNSEMDTRVTNPGTATAIGLWSQSNASLYQPATYQAFTADILNNEGNAYAVQWGSGFVCGPGACANGLYLGPAARQNTGTVNTSGTAVTFETGSENFKLSSAGQSINIAGTSYTIASIGTATTLTLTTSAGTQTGAAYFMVAPSSNIQLAAYNNGSLITSEIQTTAAGTLLSTVASGDQYSWFSGSQQLMSLGSQSSNAFLGLGLSGTSTGQVGLANGNTGGATVTVKNIAATTAYNYNLPATAGTAGQIQTSGGGGSAANTWTSTTGSGNVVLALSPAFSGTPTTALIQLSTIFTVSTLPACNTGAKGTESAVSDAVGPTYLGTLTGGGSVAVPVFCNGSSWVSY